jgi:hypothetical protein
MLTYHKVDELMGKVSRSILDKYALNYQSNLLSSIIAGFYMTYGFKREGISMSLEVINNISDESGDRAERNILVWNLYNLAEEYISEGAFEMAKKLIERAEANWSRDVILGDDIGVYHVSWIEQIWLRKAKMFMLAGDTPSFEELTDRILLSRFNFFEEAAKATGESIIGDRCTYSCLELMAAESKKRNLGNAISMIKQAIAHKGVSLNEKYYLLSQKYEKTESLQRVFNLYSRFYYKLPGTNYDNTAYGYCRTCKFINNNVCEKLNIKTDWGKACLHYNI